MTSTFNVVQMWCAEYLCAIYLVRHLSLQLTFDNSAAVMPHTEDWANLLLWFLPTTNTICKDH